MALDIYTFGSGSYVVEALQSVKMFMGSDSYVSLARIAGLLGLLWVMLAALRGRGGNGVIQADWSWLLFYAFFWVGLIVPKVDVIVNDPINPPTTASPVVTNVPLGIGALAYIVSGVGKGLVDKYETYITIPGDQKYSQNGMLFGSSLVQSLGEMQFPDARYSADMNLFIGQCAFPMIVSGTLPIDAIATSTDLWQTLSTVAPRNRWVQFSDNITRSCYDAMTDLNSRMNGQVQTAAGMAGQMLWPTRNLSTAQAAFLSSAGGTTPTDFIGMTATGADVTRQAMMANAVSSALEGQSIDTNNQAMAQAVFEAKGAQQQRNTYLTMGSIAARTLPVMKAVMEAISYALAPLIFLFVLMPGGISAFAQYALFMVWLQMWPILYAIINSIMYWYGSQASYNSSLLSDGTHGLALDTLNALSSTNADMVALAGYLALSIPMVAYMLIRGGVSAGSSVYSSLMQPASGAATAAAGEMTSGSLSMGNLSMDTASWYQMSANKMDTNSSMAQGLFSRTSAATGQNDTYTQSGGVITQMMSSNYTYGTQMNDAIRSSIGRSASESVTAARQDAVEYMASSAALSSSIHTFSDRMDKSTTTSDQSTQATTSALSQAVAATTSAQQQVSDKLGTSLQTSAGLLASASGTLGSPGEGLLGSGVKVKMGANGDAKAMSGEDWNTVRQIAKDTNYSENLNKSQSLAQQLSATTAEGQSASTGLNLQSGLQQNNALAHKSSASMQRASAFEAVRSRLEEHGISFSGDISNLMMERLGISQREFSETQFQAGQKVGGAAAMHKLQGWVDQFVASGGANELVGLQDAPSVAGIGRTNTVNRADITAQGQAGMHSLQAAGDASLQDAARAGGVTGLDPAGKAAAIQTTTQAGMDYNSQQMEGQRQDLTRDQEWGRDAEDMAHKGALGMAAYGAGRAAADAQDGINSATHEAGEWAKENIANPALETFGFEAIPATPPPVPLNPDTRGSFFDGSGVPQASTALERMSASEARALKYNAPELDAYAAHVEQKYNLPPGLLVAIKNAGEKSGSHAVSNKGAGGVMQLMPETAAKFGVSDRTDPVQSIDAAGRYFQATSGQYKGNLRAMIADYNGGPRQAAHVIKGERPTAHETDAYLSRVEGYMNARGRG